MREAALAPKQGSLPPPPAYGDVRNTIMLFGATDTNSQHLEYREQQQASSVPGTQASALSDDPPPPRYTS